MKYYASMSGTFRAYCDGKLKLEELAEANFLFGPHKDCVTTDDVAPAFTLGHNTEKPRWQMEADYVHLGSLDKPVAELWLKFRDIVKDAMKQSRVTWGDGKNYPAKIKPLLENQHEVYWNGMWQTIDQFKYMSDG